MFSYFKHFIFKDKTWEPRFQLELKGKKGRKGEEKYPQLSFYEGKERKRFIFECPRPFLSITEEMHIIFYDELRYKRREWQPIPVILLGESHGQKSLVGYSPWGCKELDTTEWLTLSLSLPFQDAVRFSCWSKPYCISSSRIPRIGLVAAFACGQRYARKVQIQVQIRLWPLPP